MGSLGKAFALVLVFLFLASLFTVQLALAQTSAPSVLDHFDFDPISPQAVGIPFNIAVTAKDQYNQTFTSYNEVNTWSATLAIQNTRYYQNLGVTGAFVNGVWSGEITLTQGGGQTYIYTNGGGKGKASDWFFVDGPTLPSVLDHFDCSPVDNRQTVGVPFSLTVTAKDQYNQTFTSYNGFNTWQIITVGDFIISYNGGTIGPFVKGIWSGQITLTEGIFSEGSARYGETFTSGRYYVANARGSFGTSGAGKYGGTNYFTIDWPPTPTQPGQPYLASFSISYIGPQYVNLPFTITITAKDQNNQTLTNYHFKNDNVLVFKSRMPEYRNGMLVPLISPTSTGAFVDGIWSGQVTINETGSDAMIITKGTTGEDSPRQGTSNVFSVDAGVPSSPVSSSAPIQSSSPISSPSPTSPSTSSLSPTSSSNSSLTTMLQNKNPTIYIGLILVIAVFLAALLLLKFVRKKP